jgi:hypothetical protein
MELVNKLVMICLIRKKNPIIVSEKREVYLFRSM